MAQLIEVGGEIVEFPDNMSEAEIASALSSTPTPPKPTPKAPSGLVKGFTDPFTGAAQLIGKGLSTLGVGYGDTLADYYTNLEKEYNAQREASGETGVDWGRVVGNVVSPVNLAIGGGLGMATKLSKPMQALVAGGLSGAASPVATKDFASSKGEQVALGGLLGGVGEKVFSGVGRMLSPTFTPAERTIRELGVTPTPGQSFGGQPKNFERFAENLPVVGGVISDAKKKVVEKFNQGVINQSLKKVNESLPEGLVGNEAISFAAKVKDNVYSNALQDTSLKFSPKDTGVLVSSIRNSKLYDASEVAKADKIFNIVALSKIPQGRSVEISGDVFKSIDSELKSEVFSLKNSGDLSDRRVGVALEQAQKKLRDMFGQQNPDKSSLLRRADALDRDLRVIQTAAANSGAERGVFTPKQYQTAVRQSDKTRNKVSFARGKANGQEVAQAAMEVLGEEADAILQGRIGAQVAGGLTIGTNPLLGAAIGTAIKAGYSPAGIRAIDALVAKRPEFAIKLGEIVKRNSAGLGGVTAQEIIDAYNNSERLGEP